MPKDVRIWEVETGDQLAELRAAELDLEKRIETWLAQDISIISEDLLVIGRQVRTSFGGVIDLLCLDANGDAVIVELKRDKTPRDITAQVLDYASWVQDLSSDRIVEQADQYLRDDGPLEDAFERQFDDQLPETLNGHHRMLVVASELDASTERILNYLSDTHGVDINAISFHYFHHHNQREFLARVFLIDPSQVEYSTRTKSGSKRRRIPSYAEHQETAEEKGLGAVYVPLYEGLKAIFDTRSRNLSGVAFIGDMEEGRRTIFSLLPTRSDRETGLRFQVYIDRLARYLKLERQEIVKALRGSSGDLETLKDDPAKMGGAFRNEEAVTHFLSFLGEVKSSR